MNKNSYLELIEKKRAFIKAAEAEVDALNAKIDALITGTTIKERYEARKAAKNEIDAINIKIGRATDAAAEAKLVIKVAAEMYCKLAANRFIEACKAGTKNLIDTPAHYKKFKAAAAAALDEENAIITNHYSGYYVNFMYYSVMGYNEIIALYTSGEGVISAADAERATVYTITPAEDIEKIVANFNRDAIKAKNIKKAAEDEINALAANYTKITSLRIEQ